MLHEMSYNYMGVLMHSRNIFKNIVYEIAAVGCCIIVYSFTKETTLSIVVFLSFFFSPKVERKQLLWLFDKVINKDGKKKS